MGYEGSARYYDLFGAKDDAAFLAGLAARCRGPALVAAAGTGREALTLAAAGVEVVAFDASPAMLAVAAAKVAAARAPVKLVRADARRFQFRRRFPLVVALNVCEHFVSDREARGFISRLREHAAPGGRVALNFATTAWRPPVPEVVETRDLAGGRRVTRRVRARPTARRDVYLVELWFDVRDGGLLVDRVYERAEVRLFRADVIRGYAAAAGLSVESAFSDFHGSAYKAGDEYAIFVLK